MVMGLEPHGFFHGVVVITPGDPFHGDIGQAGQVQKVPGQLASRAWNVRAVAPMLGQRVLGPKTGPEDESQKQEQA